MGYRKGYYRKDGTYVQGHYTKSKGKSYPTNNNNNNNNNNKGCMSVLLTFFTLGFTIYLINQL